MGDEAVHVLFAMNRWEAKDVMVEKLTSGSHIVCDRYAYSGVAYTAAKGLDFDWCLNADRGLLEPDLIIYVDIDIETAKNRGGYGEERYEKIEFQDKVRDQYKRFQKLYEGKACWRNVDGNRSKEEVTADVQKIV